MGAVQRIFDEWAELEEGEVMNTAKKYYGPLPQISMLFPSWKRSMRPLSISLFIIHQFVLGYHAVLLAISVLFNLWDSDFELASLTAQFALLASFSFFIIPYNQYQRRIFARQYEIMSTDLGKYTTGRIYDDKWCVKEKKKLHRETLYYLAAPVFIGVSAAVILGFPFISNWISRLDTPYTPRMVNRNLPIPCWYPYPTHEGLFYWVAVIGQLVTASSVGIINVQVMLYYIFNSQFLRYEFRVVGYSLRSMLSRSDKVFLEMNPNWKRTADRIDEPEYQRIVGQCLKDSVIHHYGIKELVDIFGQEVSVLGAIAFGVGTVVIGMSLFNILEGLNKKNYGNVIVFSTTVFAETIIMFVLSALGEAVSDESVRLRNQLYFMKWYMLDTSNRRTWLNFHTPMVEPVMFKSMGVFYFNLDTFTTIMNTAYSFLNLMNVQRDL